MLYETVNCADYSCHFCKKGKCKFNAFEELPCQELSDLEFHELLLNLKEIDNDENN